MGGDRASAVLLDPLKDWEIAAVPHGFRSTFRDLACRLSRNMLHAVLHGKLDESLPEPDRLEDALTSTVFGALVWTGSWNLLARWLQGGASGGDADHVAGRWECWFWPRMAFAEPDVVLRLDGALVVVEAKYRSDRHDVAVDVTADPGRGGSTRPAVSKRHHLVRKPNAVCRASRTGHSALRACASIPR